MSECTGFDSDTLCLDNSCATTSGCSIITINSDYTTLDTDSIIFVDASAGDIDITLTQPHIKFKRIDATNNIITIVPPVGETINGTINYQLIRQYEVVEFCYDDPDYAVVSEKLDRVTDTLGDILVHDGDKVVKLAVGTNGQILVADSTAPTGFAWKTPVALSNVSPYQLFNGKAVPASPTPTPIGFFAWSQSDHGGYTLGKLIIYANITVDVNRDLIVELFDVDASSIVATITATTNGIHTAAITLPTADTFIELRISKNSQGGINPKIISAIIELT